MLIRLLLLLNWLFNCVAGYIGGSELQNKLLSLVLQLDGD